jgi:TPR repeat protein
VATSYELGRGFPSNDLALAIFYYRKAADQDMPEAENRLGELLALGQGMPQNFDDAAEWFAKAAAHGLARAENNLGASYELGHGVKMDPAESARWYLKSAEAGYPKAQFIVGMLYRRHGALGFDLVKAYYWLTVSGQNGFTAGTAKRNEIVALGLMRPEDIAQANRLVTEYNQAHPRSVPMLNPGTPQN